MPSVVSVVLLSFLNDVLNVLQDIHKNPPLKVRSKMVKGEAILFLRNT